MTISLAGCTAVEAADLQQARKAVKSGGIQAVILDVDLLDGSGFDFCRELRKKSAVPVIFYTGRAGTADKTESYAAGGNLYIPKPCDIDDMMQPTFLAGESVTTRNNGKRGLSDQIYICIKSEFSRRKQKWSKV